jgi:Flp pilus assembly pilin Flp
MAKTMSRLAVLRARVEPTIRSRAQQAVHDETGATAIEWAMFALISLGIAAAVGAAIWLAVNNRIPGIT